MSDIRSNPDLRNQETYSKVFDVDIERALDEADKAAAQDPWRFSHDEIFTGIRNRIKKL